MGYRIWGLKESDTTENNNTLPKLGHFPLTNLLPRQLFLQGFLKPVSSHYSRCNLKAGSQDKGLLWKLTE